MGGRLDTDFSKLSNSPWEPPLGENIDRCMVCMENLNTHLIFNHEFVFEQLLRPHSSFGNNIHQVHDLHRQSSTRFPNRLDINRSKYRLAISNK